MRAFCGRGVARNATMNPSSKTNIVYLSETLTMPPTMANTINFEIGKLAFLKPHTPSLKEVCKKYGVEKLYVFGSLVSGEFDEKVSDVDFLVKFKQGEKVGLSLLSMMIDLEKLLNRKVDLIRERPFENEYFARSVEETKTLVYAA